MARSSVFDPIVVEAVVTTEKVRELIERRSESAKLDYKESYQPSHRVSVVRFVKHVIAMANTSGGYLVIGVADDGTVKGLKATQTAAIDEATLRAQVTSFCDVTIPLSLQKDVTYQSAKLAIVTVLPVPDRVTVTTRDGTVPGKGSANLFRAGDVLVRHGSASERWNQADAEWITDRIVKARREQWLRDFVADFQALQRLAGTAAPIPVDRSIFERSPEEFQQTVVDLLRAKNG
jgi:predicted HTH transcriptional regulator